jgi:hypothetical protein
MARGAGDRRGVQRPCVSRVVLVHAATGLSLWTLQPDPSADVLYILAMNLALWGSWAALAPLVFALGRRYRFDRHGWRRAALVHVPMSLLVTAGHIAFVASARFALQMSWDLDVAWAPSCAKHSFARSTSSSRSTGRWSAASTRSTTTENDGSGISTRPNCRRGSSRRSCWPSSAQLHPHFLFNTQHAISALVHRAPDKPTP